MTDALRTAAHAALRVVSRQAPCPHDSADTNLGNGKIWAKCEDCGATFSQNQWQRAREFAKQFDDALETLSALAAQPQGEPSKYGTRHVCPYCENEYVELDGYAAPAPQPQGAQPDPDKSIYDQRSQLDERVRRAAPMLYTALKNLLDAVEERPALADGIETVTLQDSRQLVASLLAPSKPKS